MGTDKPPAFDPHDPLGLDASLSDDEIAVRGHGPPVLRRACHSARRGMVRDR